MKGIRLMSVKTIWLLIAVVLFMTGGGVPSLSAETAVVVDDGNNLRVKGGAEYQQAPIIGVLNKGDYVRVWKKKDQWAQVGTPEGLGGWVNARCLQGAPDKVKPQLIKAELRASLEHFLQRLAVAVKSGQFQQLAPLLSPAGLILAGQPFPDAAKNPQDQARVVVAGWYATDVSLTSGSAWELLMQGTNPSKETAYLDEATGWWRIGKGRSRKDTVPLQQENPLLASHLQALALADTVFYVEGYPQVLEGFPEPESYLEDTTRLPFAFVYHVGNNHYLLKPLKGVGLIMVVTDKPVEGPRLRALKAQSP
jgi:uncharacterized protein YgiM (DUF1202 family)